ncbi:MAG: FG-GAP-like repeat-containing protein [Rubripirellula sp.]|nr:FG-GAP-like repeat-containing protein [Rubripirellula sp.]
MNRIALGHRLSWIVLLGLVMPVGCRQRQSTEVPGNVDGSASGEAERPINHWESATRALSRGNLEVADAELRNHLITAPDDVKALELSGDVAARLRDPARAVAHYRGVLAVEGVAPTASLLSKLAVELMATGSAYECLQVLQQRAAEYPQNAEAHAESIGLAAMLGLAQQTLPSMRWLTQHGQGDPELLQVLADPRRVEADGEWCGELLEENPSDLRPEFGLAQVADVKMRWDDVTNRLAPVLKRHPEFIPAHNLYGLALVQQGRFDELNQWHERLPAAARQAASYWMVAGLWARHRDRPGQAARAFWTALSIDQASYPEALPHLLFALNQIDRASEAEQVLEQIVRRTNLRDRLKTHLEREGRSQEAALGVARAMLDLGRYWEAEGWARLAVSLPDQLQADIRDQYMEIRSKLTVQTPWQLPEYDLGQRIDLSDLPEVDWGGAVAAESKRGLAQTGTVRFAQQASERGLVHETKFAETPGVSGHSIYQSVGGGVGVIDFDLDGWPDLAVAVLDGHPLQLDSAPNRLFRNLNGQFADVAKPAGYHDRGFGQGICVGDFNEDGFPDLLDANIGRNRLYRNNGDGTFSEVSLQVGLDGEHWTTCGLIADIDGDGVADLYEVAYCAGKQPYEKECRTTKGLATCVPLDFDPEPDRVWRGRGDGTFDDVTSEWMVQNSPGRGLGIVAAQMDSHPGLDLYVANDMTVNHLWSTRSNEDGLVDVGLLSGLGVSGRSQSQASMGIAAGDPDGDGDLDLFLSHFANDHNTFYEQIAPGFWADRSFQVGLAQPSMPMLGFGTEWADFDNNGSLELVIANGHVDEVEGSETLYRMPPQLFQLDDEQRWVEANHESLGSYFSRDQLGRALVTLDADRDGRVDLAITEIYGSLALLINQSVQVGDSVDFAFTSTTGQRDAIGTKLSCRVDGRDVTMQLSAGDGYMCSNQRRLHLGVGVANELEDVVVTWPSGTRESFGTLPVSFGYRIVEGSGEAFAYHQQQSSDHSDDRSVPSAGEKNEQVTDASR